MGATQSASKKRVTNNLKIKLKGKQSQKHSSVKSISKSTKSTKSAKQDNKKTPSKFSEKKPATKDKSKMVSAKKKIEPTTVQTRMPLFEEALLKEINRYRQHQNLTNLKANKASTNHIEAICKASFVKRKLDAKEVKKQQKVIMDGLYVNENIFYIFKASKKLEKVDNFVHFIMAKWQAQSNTDNNLKNNMIESCNIVIMKQDDDLCVYMVSYKGDKENRVQSKPIAKKNEQPQKAMQPQEKMINQVQPEKQVLVDTKKQVN